MTIAAKVLARGDEDRMTSANGTFRTWRDVRLESVNRLKADMINAEKFQKCFELLRLGISALDDDGRSHPCGGRLHRSRISSKQERAGQPVEPGTGIHPNRTARGYAGIRIG